MMNRTRATDVWLSAAMNPADAAAMPTATAEPGDADRAARRHEATALGDRAHEQQQRDRREDGAARDLGRYVDGQLALQHAGRRPRDRGERDVELPAAQLRALVECRCGGRRHAAAGP